MNVQKFFSPIAQNVSSAVQKGKNSVSGLNMPKKTPDFNLNFNNFDDIFIKTQNSPFLDKKPSFLSNLFSPVSKLFSGALNSVGKFFKKFFPPVQEKLSKQISPLFDIKKKEFFQEFRSTGEIHHFESRVILLKELLEKSPKELGLKRKEYVSFIKQSVQNLDKPLDLSDKEALLPRYKEIDQNYVSKKIKAIFFNQKCFTNPNLEEVEATFTPRKIQYRRAPKFKNREEIIPVLKKSSSLRPDGPFLEGGYKEGEIYDLPLKFATACYEKYLQTGVPYIKEKMPEIFEGLDENKVFKALDSFSALTKFEEFAQGTKINIEIDGRKFVFEALESGMEASTFRITSGSKSVVFKNYLASSDKSQSQVTFAPQGIYGSLGVLSEARHAGVVDLPEFYFANPIFIPREFSKERYYIGKFEGGWMVVEDANARKENKTGLKFKDWTKQNGLHLFDDKESSWVNGVCVDTGFICPKSQKDFYSSGWGNRDINDIYSLYLNGKTTDEIIQILEEA